MEDDLKYTLQPEQNAEMTPQMLTIVEYGLGHKKSRGVRMLTEMGYGHEAQNKS